MSLPLPIWLALGAHDDAGAYTRPDPVASSSRLTQGEALPHDERGLVERVRAGDAEALGEIVRVTAPRLVSFAFGFTRSRDDAEDLVQEVFAAIWQRRTEWAPESVIAYLLTAVRNRAFKMARGIGVETRYRAKADSVHPDVPPTPDVALEDAAEARLWAQRLRRLRDLLDTLTERQRTAYMLRYQHGLTIPQIAQVLGVSEKSAEQLVRRTTHTLRDRLRSAVANE
jgi:RNA polymerase sigma-70 factor (ECF subfamily)